MMEQSGTLIFMMCIQIYTCNKFQRTIHGKVHVKISEIVIKSIAELTVLCQCQFSGFDNVLWLCKILSWGQSR